MDEGVSGVGLDAIATAAGSTIDFDLGQTGRISAVQNAARILAENGGAIDIDLDGQLQSLTGSALIANAGDDGSISLRVGRDAHITSIEGSGIELASQTDLVLSGSISARNDAAIRFGGASTNDTLELRDGWRLDGFVDGGGGRDRLSISDGARLRSSQFGDDALFRGFDDLTFLGVGTFVTAIGEETLFVPGTISLDGSLILDCRPGLAAEIEEQSYDLLVAGETLDGRFATVGFDSGSVFLKPTLDYRSDSVAVRFDRVSFGSVANDEAQRRVGQSLDGFARTGDSGLVVDNLTDLGPSAARRALDQIGGRLYETGSLAVEAMFGSLAPRRERTGLPDSASTGEPLGYFDAADTVLSPAGSSANFWMRAGHTDGKIDYANGPATDWSLSSLTIGYESLVASSEGGFWGGAGLSVGSGEASADSVSSSTDFDLFHGSLYGGVNRGPWTLGAAVGYGFANVETQRNIRFGMLDRTAQADYHAQRADLSAELAYDVDVGRSTRFEPVMVLDAAANHVPDFRENGAGALNIDGKGGTATSLGLGGGVRAAHEIVLENSTLVLGARLVWQAETRNGFGAELSLAGNPAQPIIGNDVDGGKLGFSLDATFRSSSPFGINASYRSQSSSVGVSHAAFASLQLSF